MRNRLPVFVFKTGEHLSYFDLTLYINFHCILVRLNSAAMVSISPMSKDSYEVLLVYTKSYLECPRYAHVTGKLYIRPPR